MKIKSLSYQSLQDLKPEDVQSYVDQELIQAEEEANKDNPDNRSYAVAYFAGALKSMYRDAVMSGVRSIQFWKKTASEKTDQLYKVDELLMKKYGISLKGFLSDTDSGDIYED